MCIDCARRKIRRLKQANPLAEGAGWFLCIIDHDDHVHVRVNAQDAEDTSAEWVQIPAPFDVFQVALRETGIATRIHLHTPEPAAQRGCSEELIGSIPHVIFDAAAAASSVANEEVCSICYDAFSAGDEVALLPCAHQYHAACVAPWLAKATTCPACREEITESAVQSASASLPGALGTCCCTAKPVHRATVG
jgi:hypothetical protein|eukprot:COSAG06_NODE_23_length_33072_cov_44.622327_36_plen_193_part_00